MRYGPEMIGILARSLSQKLENCSIQKVDGGKDWVILKAGKDGIFISWSQDNFGASLTGDNNGVAKTMGAVRGGISLALSKHITGAKIKNIYQKNNDRVLCVEFYRYVGAGIGAKTTLVAEFMGRLSNLILLDEENRVIEAARHVHPEINRYRTIIPGIDYQGPPPLEGISIDSVSPENIEDYLLSPLGIGKVLASRLKEEVQLNPIAVSDGLKKLFNCDGDLLIQDIDGYITLWPWILDGGKEITGNVENLVYDKILISSKQKKRSELIKKGVKAIQKEIKSLGRHLDGLRKQLTMADEASYFRIKGEAILSNIGKIPPRSAKITLVYWDMSGREINLEVDLDPSLDPSQNAKKYFKKYKKYNCDKNEVIAKLREVEATLEAAKNQVETIERIEDLNVLRGLVSDLTPSAKRKPQKESEPPILKYKFNEILFLVGLNERSNRYVTFKEANANDIWFHVHEAPGSHVIMKNPPNTSDLLEQGIKIGASLALHYSKNSGKENRSVDYTFKKHVKHIQGAGPAQVTYKESKSISVDHLYWKEFLSEDK
nr:NFACT family protein [uncultured Dethiosulfovibrio sp.]